MMKSLFKGCNQISNTSLITCRTFPTCSPHNNQSLHDKPPARVAGVLVRNLILVRALKFSRESVLAVLSVHLRIAGRRHRSCTLLKASLYAQRITCARALTDIPVRDHFSLRMLVVTTEDVRVPPAAEFTELKCAKCHRNPHCVFPLETCLWVTKPNTRKSRKNSQELQKAVVLS